MFATRHCPIFEGELKGHPGRLNNTIWEPTRTKPHLQNKQIWRSQKRTGKRRV